MRLGMRIFVVGAALFVALGGIWYGRFALPAHAAQAERNSPTTAVSPQVAPASEPRSVEVITPQRAMMSRSLSVPATMEPFEQADLYAKLSGYVAELKVDIGDHVKAGDVLATIDAPEMRDERSQAKAMLDAKRAKVEAMRAKTAQAELAVETASAEESARRAELDYQKTTVRRREELFAGHAIPEQDIEEARSKLAIAEAQSRIATARRSGAVGEVQATAADVRVAEADVAVAESSLARSETMMQYARIIAPFDGVITRRDVDRGALMQSSGSSKSMPLFTLQRIDTLRIFIDVPESDVPFVKIGAHAKLRPYGRAGESADAVVTRTASSLNPNTRTMRAEIDVSNSDGRLLAGMYGQVTLSLDERPSALTIPAAALLTEGKDAFVFMVVDSRAVRTAIKTGLDDGTRVEVTQGLKDDALVIVAGKGLVADGMPVTAVRKGNPQ